jgi:hypothetical protein
VLLMLHPAGGARTPHRTHILTPIVAASRRAQLGVPLPRQPEYVTKGTVRHPKSGRVGVSREEGNVTFSRSGLAQYLIDQARTQYPAIAFHFEAACEGACACVCERNGGRRQHVAQQCACAAGSSM